MQTPEIATWQINSYYTLIIATIVLLFGRYLVRKYRFLQDFNNPRTRRGRTCRRGHHLRALPL